MRIEKSTETKRTLSLDDFEVGDGVLDCVTNKVYIVSHDLEEPTPGKLINDDEDEDSTYHYDDYDDDDDEYTDDDECDEEDDDDCDEEDDCDTKRIEHGYFLYDVDESNQVGRKHKSGPQAAIKSYFVRDLKHDFKRIPSDQLVLKLENDDN